MAMDPHFSTLPSLDSSFSHLNLSSNQLVTPSQEDFHSFMRELVDPTPYFQKNYKCKGRIEKANLIDMYITGDTKIFDSMPGYQKVLPNEMKNINKSQGLIIISDGHGWDTGYVRNIADFYGDHGILTAIPNLSAHVKDTSAVGFFNAEKMTSFEEHIKPAIRCMIDYFHSLNCFNIAILGFSWGGWATCNILAEDELLHSFSCGILAQGSLNLEERVYGGSLIDLFGDINRPLLMINSKEEPEEYSKLLKLLSYKFNTCDYLNLGKKDSTETEFHELGSGFLLKNVDQEITNSLLKQMYEYICYHNYLSAFHYYDSIDSSPRPHGAPSHHTTKHLHTIKKGWQENGKSYWENIKEKAAELKINIGEKIESVRKRTSSTGEEILSKLEGGWETTKEKASGLFGSGEKDKMKEKVDEGWEKTDNLSSNLYEKAGGTWEKTKEKVGEVSGTVKEKVEEGWEKTKKVSGEMLDKTKDVGTSIFDKSSNIKTTKDSSDDMGTCDIKGKY